MKDEGRIRTRLALLIFLHPFAFILHPFRCSAHHPADGLEQLLLLDRLEQVGVDPRFLGPSQIAGPVPGGQQDDPRGRPLGPFANLSGQGQAIRVGHAGI